MPDAPNAPLISWDKISEHGSTGDLFLFHGDSWISWGVEVFTTYGPFSHITMMYKTKSMAEPWLWQANPTLLAYNPSTHPDSHHAITPVEGKYGAQIGYLDQALNTLATLGDVAYYRPLLGTVPANIDERVAAVMTQQAGTPFGELWQMAADYEEGYWTNTDLLYGDSIFFCSKLVAYTYQHAGVLGDTYKPNAYAPNDFDVPHTPELLGGAKIGPLFKVDMSTVPGYGVPPA